jgi:GH15 family glucan-1,4-alpha-glucosidase
VGRWAAERDRIYRQIMNRGWHPGRRAFVQHYDADVLDASVLLMPIVGFIAPRDPIWLQTLDAIEQELVSDSLVYRYNPEASPDGLRGVEATFSLCTFWYVDALARAGRVEAARLAFTKMLTYGNHLGLFGEEIGLTGEQLGNFPQAFTHLALINSAINLDRQLDEPDHRFPPFETPAIALRRAPAQSGPAPVGSSGAINLPFGSSSVAGPGH